MKFSSLHAAIALAGMSLLLAGCPKKPLRPDPASTMLGPQGGGSSSVIPQDLGNFGPGTDLEPRGDGWDANNQNRDALAAQTVYFEFNQSTIKPSEREKLRAAKQYLDDNPSHRLLLEGHCDWRGTAEYNLGLGDRRANAVKRFLQSLGVPADRLETTSKGSLEAARNADEATMAKDRRVDLIVTRPGTGAPSAF